MITDEQIIQILDLTTHPPDGKHQREGIGTFLGPDSALISRVREILSADEDAPGEFATPTITGVDGCPEKVSTNALPGDGD